MKEAKPVDYRACYLAEASEEGVEPIGDAILSDSPCVALEIKDIQIALTEAVIHQGLDPLALDVEALGKTDIESHGNVTLYFRLSDARHLCCHLIHALARTGDRVATRLEEAIRPAISESSIMDGEGDPYGEEDGGDAWKNV